jgi:hypothetical protein
VIVLCPRGGFWSVEEGGAGKRIDFRQDPKSLDLGINAILIGLYVIIKLRSSRKYYNYLH